MPDPPYAANPGYTARINRAIDYITEHLAEPLPLEDVARAAHLSPFYFHRIFKSIIGETLASFVKRTRLERALYVLSHRHGASLTETALSCGFTSSSDFSRSFRAHYGVSPRNFDLERFRRERRDVMRASLPAPSDAAKHLNPDGFVVSVRPCAARRVAYIRVHRPYEGDHVMRAVERLIAWAEARDVAGGQWLGYQWDDPEIVALDQIRYDTGVEVGDHVSAEGEVGITTFPACQLAEIEIKGGIDVELRAIDWMFTAWLPASGYAPAHQPMFEAFHGRPFAHGTEYFELRVQLPVVNEGIPL